MLMGLLGIWNINCLELPTLAVLPYDGRLRRFPAYLQQLDMESNGKSVNLAGRAGPEFDRAGDLGRTRQQRPAFLLPDAAPGHAARCARFPAAGAVLRAAIAAQPSSPSPTAWRRRMHSLLDTRRDQAAAELAARKLAPARIELLARHKVHAGNRPVSIVAFERLDARTLGSLVALYEHKVFTQSVIWGINAFDQWGVELGKKMCEEVLPLVRDPGAPRRTPMLKPLLDPTAGVAAVMVRCRGARFRATRLCVAACCRRSRPARADAGWFESGDTQLRLDLQLLNDAEVIRYPLNQWPLPRAAVQYALANAKEHVATNSAVDGGARARARARRRRPAKGAWLSIRGIRGGEPGLWRDFDTLAREDGEFGAGLTYSTAGDFPWDSTSRVSRIPLTATRCALDGSHATVQSGNWLISANTLDRWWGPGARR